MNTTLRRAVAATTLALAAIAGNAFAQETTGEPMLPAFAINPEDNQLAMKLARAFTCTADAHQAITSSKIYVSLSDIVKKGHIVDVGAMDDAILVAQMTGDDFMLKEELEKYDFSKADAAKIVIMLADELAPITKEYSAMQFHSGLDEKAKQDITNAFIAVIKKYEEETGVTIALEFAGGGLSPQPTPACQAALAP